jgi:dTDP-4-dehydrorhamnose reductase
MFGGAGQLGCELAKAFEARRYPYRSIAHAQADVADEAAVRPFFEMPHAAVVNAAAYTRVDQAEDEPAAAFRANRDGPALLARLCARAGTPLIHISTDYVFDGRKTVPYVETDRPNPINVYGRSKLAGEAAVAENLREHVILRTSWVFGEHGRNFLKTILRLCDERGGVEVVTDQRGCPTCTIDLAEAICTIIGRIRAGGAPFGLYHVASPEAVSWHDFAKVILQARERLTGKAASLVPVLGKDFPGRASRPANSALDSSRFFETFGFRAANWRARASEVVARLLRGTEAKVS